MRVFSWRAALLPPPEADLRCTLYPHYPQLHLYRMKVQVGVLLGVLAAVLVLIALGYDAAVAVGVVGAAGLVATEISARFSYTTPSATGSHARGPIAAA